MKILVAIANHGFRNARFVGRLLDEYRSMPFKVDVVVLSDVHKNYGESVKVMVGAPTDDPWSLPFGHKALFAQNADAYDLFIYSEDDVLIRTEHIRAFMKATAELGDDVLPGFIRYELRDDGKRSYPDIHDRFHWVPNSVERRGTYLCARLTNDHSACYVLTRSQLERAVASGGFLVPPHRGQYDLLCTAGTDPYTQCGFTRVICISHLRDFEVHHLPNAYVQRRGLVEKDCAVLEEDGYCAQIAALHEIAAGRRCSNQLLNLDFSRASLHWDKSYYEPARSDLLKILPPSAKTVLSVGCGWGATELKLVEEGKQVTSIPLDSVIGAMAARRGLRTTTSDLDRATGALGLGNFDAILVSGVLQHVSDPVSVLAKLGGALSFNGSLIGSVSNLGPSRMLLGKLFARNKDKFRLERCFERSGLHLASGRTVTQWFAKADGFESPVIRFQRHEKRPVFGRWLAPHIVFSAKKRLHR